jgi:hypothetical protein
MPDIVLFFLMLAGLAVLIIGLVHLSMWLRVDEAKDHEEKNWYRDPETPTCADDYDGPSIAAIAHRIDAIGNELYAQRRQQNHHENVRSSLERIGVAAAIIAATLAGLSAWIFQNQLVDAREATIEANRAWVGIYRADHGIPIATKPMYIQLTLVNTGRQPALRGSWGFKIYSVNHIPEDNRTFTADSALPRNDACDGVHLFPVGEGTSIWHTLFHTPDPGNANDPRLGPVEISYVSDSSAQADIDAALTRSKSLIVDACFVYWSGGQRRQTSARFLLRDRNGAPPSDWGFNQIPSGNSAD